MQKKKVGEEFGYCMAHLAELLEFAFLIPNTNLAFLARTCHFPLHIYYSYMGLDCIYHSKFLQYYIISE